MLHSTAPVYRTRSILRLLISILAVLIRVKNYNNNVKRGEFVSKFIKIEPNGCEIVFLQSA